MTTHTIHASAQAEPGIFAAVAVIAIVLTLCFLVLRDKPSRRKLPPKYRPNDTFKYRPPVDPVYRPNDTYKPAPPKDYSKPAEIVPWTPVSKPAPRSMADPLDQLRTIRESQFETVPLLNRQEARLLPLIERTVRDHGNGHRVMAQTSLGELIRPKGESFSTNGLSAARASINSKRLDFAIINRWGHLTVAIEYQGSGHHINDDAFLRDAVKREALRKAGVPLIEVSRDYSTENIARQIRDILVPNKPTASAASPDDKSQPTRPN